VKKYKICEAAFEKQIKITEYEFRVNRALVMSAYQERSFEDLVNEYNQEIQKIGTKHDAEARENLESLQEEFQLCVGIHKGADKYFDDISKLLSSQ
jgi:iron-sulfur cluster repair protein YtfE (RIC family)